MTFQNKLQSLSPTWTDDTCQECEVAAVRVLSILKFNRNLSRCDQAQ